MQAVIYEGHLRNPNKPEDVALHKEGAVLNNLRELGCEYQVYLLPTQLKQEGRMWQVQF